MKYGDERLVEVLPPSQLSPPASLGIYFFLTLLKRMFKFVFKLGTGFE